MTVWIDGKRIRRSTGKRTKQGAHQRAVDIVAGLRREAGLCDWRLIDAMRDTYDRIWCKQKSAVHVFKRVEKLARDYPETSELLLPEVTYDALVRFGNEMERRGSKDATINRFLALISKALVEALKLGKLERKPLLPYRKESKGKLRWITRDEERVLRDKTDELWTAADARRMRALIVVLVDTGARLSEILKTSKLSGLTQITLTDTKNDNSRAVPLTERAQEALPQVPNWTAMQAIGRFSRLRDACGLPDVTLHTLRHTCASRLVQGGMDLYRVKEWLGHSSITVTQRYAHLSPTHLASGVDILSGATD